MNFSTNLNRAFFKKFANANENVTDDMYDEFADECVNIANSLMLMRGGYKKVNASIFDLGTFVRMYLMKNLNSSNNIKIILEKYIVDTVYGKGKMNAKFNAKHKSTPAQKLAKLEKIKQYINDPVVQSQPYFNWTKLNDPDFYDMKGLDNHGYTRLYAGSLNSRISKYRRMVNQK